MSHKRLRVGLKYQKEPEWCWAAAAEMVLRYYHGGDVQQDELANEIFDRDDCTQTPDSKECDKGIGDLDVARLYDEWQVKSTLVPGPVEFSVLKDEIEAERPVEVAYTHKEDNGGHLVIVRGYREDQNGQFVTFNDPWPFYTSGEVPFQDFKTELGRGDWSGTWIGVEPK